MKRLNNLFYSYVTESAISRKFNSQEIDQKALLEKLRADSKRTKARLAKMEEEQAKVKFPVKDELLEALITASAEAAATSSKKSATVEMEARKEIPAAVLQLNSMLPEGSVDDAVLVWDFLNVFRCVFISVFFRSFQPVKILRLLVVVQQNAVYQLYLVGRLCGADETHLQALGGAAGCVLCAVEAAAERQRHPHQAERASAPQGELRLSPARRL